MVSTAAFAPLRNITVSAWPLNAGAWTFIYAVNFGLWFEKSWYHFFHEITRESSFIWFWSFPSFCSSSISFTIGRWPQPQACFNTDHILLEKLSFNIVLTTSGCPFSTASFKPISDTDIARFSSNIPNVSIIFESPLSIASRRSGLSS